MGLLENIPVVRELNSYAKSFEKKVSDFLIKAIEEQFLIYFLYEFKVEELKKSVTDLQKQRDMMQRLVDNEYRNGNDPVEDVLKWFQQVDNLIDDIDEYQQDKRHSYTMCSNGYLPKPGMRYRLAKKAYILARHVDNLKKTTAFSNGLSSGLRPMSADFLLSVANFEIFESRKQVTENITKALKDTTVKMVGVHGIGGVGKTTLVKELAREAQRDKLFDVVIFAVVAKTPDIKQIQGQLADQLGARLNEETEIGRASRLRDVFKKEKKNTLVILDDLWAELDLNKLGIPIDDINLTPRSNKEGGKMSGDDQEKEAAKSGDVGGKEGTSGDGQAKTDALGDSKVLKILLTSRSKEVVFDKMQVKENSSFPIKGLEDQEAKDLFKKIVGMVDKPPEFKPLADKISNKCGGLPIAIVTIGKTLRTKSYSQWKDTLCQLEQQKFMEVAESVDFLTRLSFNYLETEDLKSTFLLCAQLGPHPLIKDLVKYCVGIGIFEGFLTIKETHEKVLRLIEKLKDSSLLLDSYSNDRFNMHDMIRENALSIASKEQPFFTMQNRELKEWPDENEFKKYNVISIRKCAINDKLPNSVSCPRLKIFNVDSLNPSFKIPKAFFKKARQLRVLILTGIDDKSNFCYSIGYLTNLRMLCLKQCLLGDISFIGKLEKLRILSLQGSKVENLPTELGKLQKLQLLDISNCLELGEIQPNVLSSLNNLEELYMRNSVKWESEENKRENNILAELRHLHQLKNLDICIPNAALLPRNLLLNKLYSYKIVIGDFETFSRWNFMMPVKDEASRVLALQIKENNVIHYQACVKMLFRGVEKMFLGELEGVRSIFYELNMEGFPCLKELVIVNNADLKCIIDPKELLNLNNVFPILESLFLYNLRYMTKISHATNLSGTSFSRLKVVRIRNCEHLENVFSLSMVVLLKNLETIDIFKCESLKTIVPKEGHGVKKINFPKLRTLALDNLYKFTGVYSNGEGQNDEIVLLNKQVEIPNLESLELSSIEMKEICSQSKPFENLTKLNLENCAGIKYLFSFSMAKSMKKLKCLSVSKCFQLVEIFKYEDDDKHEARKVRVFLKLEEIHLNQMSMLTTIWPRECSPDSFTDLNSMSIGQCSNLVSVLPSQMVGRFGKLESLKIYDCHSVEQIFDLNDAQEPSVADATHLQILQIKHLRKLKHIWNEDPEGNLNFKRLHSIEVTECDELEYLFPVSVAKGLQELDSLSISYCRQMKEIAFGDEGLINIENFELPQVSIVEMQYLPKLQYFLKGTRCVKWPKLKKLSIFGCDRLEVFEAETPNLGRGSIFLPKEVIPNLETLEMNLEEVDKLEFCIKSYRMNHLKSFLMVSCPSIETLNQFLHRMPYLESLTLFSSDLTELIPIHHIGTFQQLKYLKLGNLNALENIGFERGPVLQYYLEQLCIDSCGKLINLAPSSVTLTQLTILEVHNCLGMEHLMGFSMAKSLVHLISLKVTECKGLKLIVARRNDEEVEITYKHGTVFRRLMTLELVDLPSLSCFCSSFEIHEFPSLEKFIVARCYKMTKFCNQACAAPNLQVIKINKKEENCPRKGDLNDRILEMFMSPRNPRSRHISLSDNAELAYLWRRDPLPDFCFMFLETLVLENCEFLSTAIPSHFLVNLHSLVKLEVRRCSSVEAIFDIKNNNANVEHCYLKKMTLEDLPKMKHVWSNNNPKGMTLRFEYLKEVKVTDCGCVQTLFPAISVTKRLTTLGIQNCGALEEIIGEVEENKEVELPG